MNLRKIIEEYNWEDLHEEVYGNNVQDELPEHGWLINGEWFKSLYDAAKHLEISYEHLRSIANGTTSSNKYDIEKL